MDWDKIQYREALEFIRNVAKMRTEEPNDAWSTVFHVSQDALDGHARTLDELRANSGA